LTFSGLYIIRHYIMSNIDWTKPVRVKGDNRKCHVVSTDYRETPESEPVVVVNIDNGWENAPAWSTPLHRTLDNRLVNQDSRGKGVVFENVPEEETIFVRVSPYGTSVHRKVPDGEAVVAIELTYVGGIAKSAKLFRANEPGHEHGFDNDGSRWAGNLTFYD
jgi:hypothetical protein